ncbi:MAG: hypothetical protein AAGJ53_03230, partial [Pseudomonadota bacterium]
LIVAPAGTGAHDLDQLRATLDGNEGPVPDPAPPEVAKLRNLIIVTGTPSARANSGQRRVHIAVDAKTGTAQKPAQPSNQGGDASVIAAARVAAIAAQLLAKTPDTKADALAAGILARAVPSDTTATRFGRLTLD